MHNEYEGSLTILLCKVNRNKNKRRSPNAIPWIKYKYTKLKKTSPAGQCRNSTRKIKQHSEFGDVFISVVVFDDHLKIDKLLTTFGKGEDLRWIPIQDIVKSLGPGSKALSFSHAFKGCDTVSAFVGK